MATKLEVNASTEASVAAFARLASAINNAATTFLSLTQKIEKGNETNKEFTGGFDKLLKSVGNTDPIQKTVVAFNALLNVIPKVTAAEKALMLGRDQGAAKHIAALNETRIAYDGLLNPIRRVTDAEKALAAARREADLAAIASRNRSSNYSKNSGPGVSFNNLGLPSPVINESAKALSAARNQNTLIKPSVIYESAVAFDALMTPIRKVTQAERDLAAASIATEKALAATRREASLSRSTHVQETAVAFNNLGIAIPKVTAAERELIEARRANALIKPAGGPEVMVGFNNLGVAIKKVSAEQRQLNETVKQQSLAKASADVARYANGLTAINSVFQGVISGFRILSNVATVLGAGLQLIVSSLLGQLDKLQGFNAIISLTTNTADEAAKSYNFLRSTADKLGIQFDNVARDFAKLTASLPKTTEGLETAQRAFLGISLAARTMHATGPDTNLMFYAITQIASKGVVSMEELRRQLGEKLPGTMNIAARAVNTSVEAITKAVSNGTVDSTKFLKAFSDELIRTFTDSAAKAGTSVSAALARLTNVWVDFSKAVLDNGGADAIANTLDALRDKLTDPYVVTRFAELIKYLANKLTEFISKLTTEDIRNGFDTFTRFCELATTAIGKLISGLTWVINNGASAGAVIGAIGGALAGASAGLALNGPLGALIGAGVGAAMGAGAGAYVGNKLTPTTGEKLNRQQQDTKAEEVSSKQFKDDDNFRFNALKPMLKNFKGLDPFAGLGNLYKSDKLNPATLVDLNKILTGKEYKTDAARNEAVKMYSKSNQVLGPNTTQLSDVLTTSGKSGKGKQNSEQISLDASYNKAIGLNPNFDKEMRNYIQLNNQGKLSAEQFADAKARLIAEQPAFSKAAKAESEEQKRYNKDLNTNMDLAFKLVETKEQITKQLEKEHDLAGLTANDLEVESKLIDIRNKLEQNGAGEEYAAARSEAYRTSIIDAMQLKEVTQAQNTILDATVDKYRQLINVQKGIDKSLAEPKSGLTPQAANDYTIKSDPGFKGSTSWIDAQKRSVEEYYAYIDLLRNKNRIDDESANLAKGKASVQLQQDITAAYIVAAEARLQAGSTNWADVALDSIGRVALGFTTLTAGTSAQLGQFFQSFTDGFANSIGRAVVFSENLGDALRNVAREGIATLISSLAKLGVQWLVNAAVGQSIAASSAAASVGIAAASGAATALAWAPAAALVSLATLGANAAPASAAIIGTNALSQGIAFSALAGFENGGYTGGNGRKNVAGVVHGQEFVVNASATARNREMLEAINAGATVTAGNGGSSGPITVQSPAVNQRIINIIDPSMVKDYLNSDEGEQVIVNVVRRNKSAVS